jgi:hypothetical protein
MLPEHTMSKLRALSAFALTFTVLSPSAFAQDDDQQPTEPEVLTRGPVHEAFAEPVTFNADDAYVIPKEPPQAVDEVPPDTKPQGSNVQWIGGYWSWDEERQDFIWVSGVWRDIPPGKHWVQGYYKETSGGFQWVPGYWAPDADEQPNYIASAPPATLEQGPTSEAPSSDYLWIPGTWMWSGRWAWRPGYWMTANPDWVWVPSYYSWTPFGYVYIDGYWDYSIGRRGYFFAPVYYGPNWVWGGYRYRPVVVIGGDVLVDHFFCYPRYRHYYFGDYYAADYSHRGIYPWFAFHMSRYGYDPIYAHQSWYYRRTDPTWESRVRQNYQYRQAHVDARPPPTYRQQQILVQRHDPRVEHAIAMPVRQYVKSQPAVARPISRTPPPKPAVVPRPDPTIRPEAHRPDALQHPTERIERRNVPTERAPEQRIEERRQPERFEQRATPEQRPSQRFEERRPIEREEEHHAAPPPAEHHESPPPAEHHVQPPPAHFNPPPAAPPPAAPPQQQRKKPKK